MSLITTWERGHTQTLLEVADIPLPAQTWKTPDGCKWVPQKVLHGWGPPRSSDHWAWLILHTWVVQDDVTVWHVELPQPLQRHAPSDCAWQSVVGQFGPGIVEPLTHPFGRADLCIVGDAQTPPLMVEFGTCTPVKFVVNLGYNPCIDWMLVPYNCPYGFVFNARKRLIKGRTEAGDAIAGAAAASALIDAS